MYDKTRAAGVIPFVSWLTTSSAGSAGLGDAQIANGSQDPYITQWAQAAKAWGHPFFLRFDWEMNGNWWPWSPGVNGNTAADFVAMWRHVHDIFTKVGATNVTWVWCPNIDPSNAWTSLQSLYPGDAYVDWTCLDGYNGDDPWTSFHDLYSSTYHEITTTIAPTKPMIIGEVASTELGGSKAAWITSMLGDMPVSFPKVHGFLWYDANTVGQNNRSDWPIESSSSAQSAFAGGIANSVYASNTFANTGVGSPVPVP
jgi:beta-mannanase